jgi:hypothetical protein
MEALKEEVACAKHFFVTLWLDISVDYHPYAADFAKIGAGWMGYY